MTDSEGTDSGVTDSEAELSPTTSAFVSPLDEYIGAGAAAQESASAASEQEQQVQVALATCMADEGFEYVPTEYTEGGDEPVSDPYKYYGTREWAAKYGYGITTADELYPTQPQEEQPIDPNEAIVEQLSAAEQTAYFEALYGTALDELAPAEGSGAATTNAATTVVQTPDVPTPDVQTPDAEITGTPEDPEDEEGGGEDIHGSAAPTPAGSGGCQEAAAREVYGDAVYEGTDTGFDRFNDMFDELSALYEDQPEDPATAAALVTWQSCMADAGYPGVHAGVRAGEPDPDGVHRTAAVRAGRRHRVGCGDHLRVRPGRPGGGRRTAGP